MKQIRILSSLLLLSLFLGYGTVIPRNINTPNVTDTWIYWLLFVCGLIIFGSYSSISIQIGILIKRYKEEIGIKNIRVLWFFVFLISICGIGHLLDVVVALNHTHVSILVMGGRVFTACATLITAIILWPMAHACLEIITKIKSERDDYKQQIQQWSNLPGTLMATQKLSDPLGPYIWVNDEWESILGWSREELTTIPWQEFIHPADIPLFTTEKSCKPYINSMIGYYLRYRHKQSNADGSPRWIWTRWDAMAHRDTDLVYGTARDVTEQIQASNEADLTRIHLDNWLAVFPDLLVTLTIDTIASDQKRYLWVSPSCENILGWTFEEMKNIPWVQFVHPEDLNDMLCTVYTDTGKKGSEKIDRYRLRMCHKTGGWRWVEWSGVIDHNLKMYYGVGRDVTERVNRQASLELSENRFRSAMHNAPIGLALVTLDGKWLDVNPTLCSLLGYDKNTLLSMYVKDVIHPDEKGLGSLKDLMTNKKSSYQCDKRCIHKMGSILHTHIGISLVRNATTPQYYIVQIQDRTEDVKKQDAIENHIRDLEQFASIAAHQLKSPPRTIYGIAQALLEDYGDVIDEDGKGFIEDIKQDAKNMAEVVNGLYKFSKVRTSSDIEKEDVDISRVITDIINTRRSQDELYHIEIIGKLPHLNINKILISEVLSNLIDNGLKFNASTDPTISIRSEITDLTIKLIISDNGIGVPKAYHHKMFKMFERVHLQYPGTGVGLAVASSIVEKFGGKISLESEEGGGTTFTLEFPK